MVATDVSCAGSCPILTFIRVIQPRSKLEVEGECFFTPYPVCAAAGKTARAAPNPIATARILVTFISGK